MGTSTEDPVHQFQTLGDVVTQIHSADPCAELPSVAELPLSRSLGCAVAPLAPDGQETRSIPDQ